MTNGSVNIGILSADSGAAPRESFPEPQTPPPLPSLVGESHSVTVTDLLRDSMSLAAAQRRLAAAQCRQRDTERLLQEVWSWLISPFMYTS